MTYQHRHVVITIILLLILLCPWMVGLYFKISYFQFIKAINQDTQLEVKILDYKQGWISSTATIEIRFPQSFLDLYQIELLPGAGVTVREYIDHGPVIYNRIQHRIGLAQASMHSDIYLSEALQMVLVGKLRGLGWIELDTIARLNGDWGSQIRIPILSLLTTNFDITVKDGLYGKSLIKTSRHEIKATRFKIESGAIVLKSKLANQWMKQFTLQPVQYQSILTKEDELWSGRVIIRSAGANLLTSDNSNFSADDIAMNSAFSFNENTFYNASLSMTAEIIKTPSTAFPSLSNVVLTSSTNDLNIQSLVQYLRYLLSDTSQLATDLNMQKIQTLLTHTIEADSDLSIEINMDTPLGPLAVAAKIILEPNARVQHSIQDVLNNSQTNITLRYLPAFVEQLVLLYQKGIISKREPVEVQLQKVYQLKILQRPTTPTAAVNPEIAKLEPGQLINALILAGYIIKNQNIYETTLTLKHNKWYINNIPLTGTQ